MTEGGRRAQRLKRIFFCKGVPPSRPPQAPGMLENQFQQRASCGGVPKVLPQASLAVYLRVKLKNILLEEAIKVLLFSEMLTQIFATKTFPQKLLQICVNFSFFHPKLLCKPSLSKHCKWVRNGWPEEAEKSKMMVRCQLIVLTKASKRDEGERKQGRRRTCTSGEG